MAAKTKSTSTGSKIVFGKKGKKGKLKKKCGPKENRPKKYVGQGR